MCLGCSVRKPKAELIRIVRDGNGRLTVDRTQKMNTRGAYLCGCDTCFSKAVKRKSLDRALKCHFSAEEILALGEMIGKEHG